MQIIYDTKVTDQILLLNYKSKAFYPSVAYRAMWPSSIWEYEKSSLLSIHTFNHNEQPTHDDSPDTDKW